MKEFTETQPKHGDVILHCGHLDVTNHHFWKIPEHIGFLQFRRPDGSMGKAQWVVGCELCFQASGGDPQKMEIRGDDIWVGDEPAVKRMEI